jgi:hypothetical protein
MKVNKPKNSNYAAVVVEITSVLPLEGCDNVQAAIIMGNQVIVSKETKIGEPGLYFPLECQLSKEYLSANNLYRKPGLNKDSKEKGYFEENGRIRCVKFRGHRSEGLFMPTQSLVNMGWTGLELQVGDEFDEINGVPICSKYVVNQRPVRSGGGKGRPKQEKKQSKLIEGQFRFHDDTSMLYKNLHKIDPYAFISITYKLHGTSGISAKVLCKKKLSMINRIAKFLGVNVIDTQYDELYSSRKVIKNEELSPNAQHYYKEDIWKSAHETVKHAMINGMTLYYEIVGYTPGGSAIQGKFDYGQTPGTFGVYIYRITMTNVDGKVFEFSVNQLKAWCRKTGLQVVPELYYGLAKNFAGAYDPENFQRDFLYKVKEQYNEKDCYMCVNKVPEEGCVIRVEGLEIEAYKQKSNRFYELETKLLDKGETNIEDEES